MLIRCLLSKNTRQKEIRVHKLPRKLVLMGVLALLFSIGVAVAEIYNSMQVESRLGVTVSHFCVVLNL